MPALKIITAALILALCVSASAAVGGTQGAATAATVDANNRQLHPTEIQWIKANAKAYAERKGISVDAAERRLAEQAFRQVQLGVEGGAAAWDADASAFLRNAHGMLPADGNSGPGYMFQATAGQKADATMYLNTLVSSPDALAFYSKNGLQQPTLASLTAAAQRDTEIRANLGTATRAAFAAAATISLAGVPPTLLGWALSNPVAATSAGIITAETAAAITSGAVSVASLAPILASGGVKVVATIEQAIAGQAARATTGAFVNAAKVCESGCAIGGLTQQEQALVTTIKNGGDAKGAITETLLTSVAQRTGMDVLAGGKYGSNNGFDLVLKAKDGAVTIILDGKQLTAGGAVQLSGQGAGGTNQLSTAWVNEVIRRLGKNSEAVIAIEAAKLNGTLNIAVGGVNRTTGQLLVVPVTVPNRLIPR